MPEQSLQQRRSPIPNLRWWICGILFIATTINYVDRQSLAVLKSTIEKDIHLSEANYGWINFSFSTAYAIFYTIAGRLVDAFGVRAAFTAAVVLWSAMAASHALVRTWEGFAVARFLLGMAESANFPASIKAVAQWFPQRERALATGIFNSGSNVGIMVAIVVVQISNHWSWRVAFLIIGALGVLWTVGWLFIFRDPDKHPRLGEQEREYIEGGKVAATEKIKVPWYELLRHRQIWPYLIAKFLTDPVWWFFLYYLPDWLHKNRGMDNLKSAESLIYPYTASMVGSIVLGWLSGRLIKQGWRVGPARYTAMFICAAAMGSAFLAARAEHNWVALCFISVATAAHQGWSANLFTTASDLFPARMTGAITGLGGTAGAIGGMLMTLLVGSVLEAYHHYNWIFVWASLMHMTSLVGFFLLAGFDFKRVEMEDRTDLSRQHTGLILGGGLLLAVSALMIGVIAKYWQALVEMSNAGKAAADRSISGPLGGATAFVLTSLIALAIIYAGLPKASAPRA